MKVLEAQFVKDFTKMCHDGYMQGWHEGNGGNISYRMRESEVEAVREELNESGEWKEIGGPVPGLANEYFVMTGSGKFLRNVELDFADTCCIVKVNEDGTKYKVVWGLVNGGRPTSELPAHLMNLESLKARDPELRIVYHCHSPKVTALTFVLPMDEVIWTRELWEMVSECSIFFPQGVGLVEWMMPGSYEISKASAEIMKTKNVVIWVHHGMFACGHTFDETFGLMHIVEKAASILVDVISMGGVKRQAISVENFRAIEKVFGVHFDEKYLYERKSNKVGEY